MPDPHPTPKPLLSMSPLKNTDKRFSDYLPPALVKDWRQCFRSRSSVALFLLLEVAGWIIFGCMVADADQTPSKYLEHLDNLGKMLYMLGVCALCLIIPFRAGSTVAADTRVRSSNFLMLTPLSARRIAWGTWSSTALIVLLAAVLALPLLYARRAMMTAYPHIGVINLDIFDWAGFTLDALLLGWLVVAGWVMAAFYMFSAVLPRLLRVLLLIFCGLLALALLETDSVAELFRVCGSGCGREGQVNPPSLPLMVLYLVDAAMLLVLLIELARRHYAAPAENCSRAVRLLAPLPFLVFIGLAVAETQWGCTWFDVEVQFVFAFIYLFTAMLSDALLPIYAMPAHAYRLWRGVPAWLQKPGFVSSTLFLAAVPFTFLLVGFVSWMKKGSVPAEDLWKAFYSSLNLGVSLMLWLLITDCVCRRSDMRRPLVFGVVALACTLTALCVKIPLEDMDGWVGALPLCDGMSYRATTADYIFASQVDGAAFVFLLLLLVFWRGRVRKA